MFYRRDQGFSRRSDVSQWYYFDVALLPTSVESSAGVVTRWRDESGKGNHATPTGSPAVDTTLGSTGDGVTFDGVNDRLDCTLATAIPQDQPCHVWILHKPSSVTPGGRSGILEFGKTGAGNESLWIHTSFGSIVARMRAVDLGDSSATTDMQVTRVDVHELERSIYRNGAPRGSNGQDTAPGVEITKYRLGNRLAGDVSYYAGSIFAVLVRFGTMTDAEIKAIDDKLHGWGGIDTPYDYADIPAATVTTGDPRFLLPAVTHCLANYPLTFDLYSVGYRDGRVTRTVSSDLPVNRLPDGRVVVIPPEAGTYTLSITEGSYTATTSLVARALPTSLASPVVVLPFGNSQMHRMQSGLLEYVRRLIGSSYFSTVGSVAAPTGFNCRAEGRDSWVMSQTAYALGASGAFDRTGSPFYNGGASLDLAGYFAGLSVTPTDVTDVWLSGFQNAPYLATLVNLEATLAAEVEATVNIFEALAIECGLSTRFRVFTEFPLEAEPKAGTWGSWAQSSLYHQKAHRCAEVIATLPALMPDLDVEIIPTFHHVGVGIRPRSGWADAIHLNAGPGHRALISPVLGHAVKDWT